MSSTFVPAVAAAYGKFIDSAYDTYNADNKTLTPVPINVPPGYTVDSYVSMQDFLVKPGTRVFYGFILKKNDGTEWVLAMRGTIGYLEWWDNLHLGAVSFPEVPGSGHVVQGFAEIYATLAIENASLGGAATPKSAGGAPFAQQVASAIAASAGAAGGGLPTNLVVTGHSLGSALVTLFIMENGFKGALHTPGVYTFASPRVGNGAFVDVYERMSQDRGIATWRIVNTPDIVPNVPPDLLGWAHVNTLELYNSGGGLLSAADAHKMSTYENLLAPPPPAAGGVAPVGYAGGAAPDGNVTAAQGTLPVDPSFRGAPPLAYRIASKFGVLVDATDDLSDSVWLNATSIVASFTPLYFHAPPFFVKRDKMDAYAKMGVAQHKPQVPLTKQLKWALMAPLLTGEHQDIQSIYFSDLGDNADALSTVPLPGGRGELSCPACAVTGGDVSKGFRIIFDTYDKLRKIADPTSQLMVGIAIPAAGLAVADQYEALLHQLLQAFTPAAQLERTIDPGTVSFTTMKSSDEDGLVKLPGGVSYLVLFPEVSNPRDHVDGAPDAVLDYHSIVDTAITAKQQFKIDVRGPIISETAANNPFDRIPYITFKVEVEKAAAPTG